jgi:hypothetical protein
LLQNEGVQPFSWSYLGFEILSDFPEALGKLHNCKILVCMHIDLTLDYLKMLYFQPFGALPEY